MRRFGTAAGVALNGPLWRAANHPDLDADMTVLS